MISSTDGECVFSLTPATCTNTTNDFPVVKNVTVYSPTADVTVCGKSIDVMEGDGRLTNVTVDILSNLTAAAIVRAAQETLGVAP